MAALFSKTTDRLNFSAKLSEDKIKLFIDVETVNNANITREDILALVKECAQAATIHDGVIDDIVRCLNSGEKVTERRIAKGVAPVPGADGKLLLLVKKFTQVAEVKIDAKGYADYGSLHLFDNVSKGNVVGRLYPPKNGTDGIDALGNNMSSAPGKPLKLALDKTISLRSVHTAEQNYEELVAEEDGYLSEENGKYIIKQELYVKNNLDYRFGSIDFIGKVKVSGDIMPGFNITAKKGIEILGTVRGGSLVCMEGDIIVKGFVYGGKDSRVICGRSFTANVVQEINAEIAGPIIINKEAIDSNLRTESTLSVPGGQLVGGQSFAVCGVEAKKIGNEAGKVTSIVLCSNIETHTEYAKVLANIESHERAKKMLELHLGPLVKHPERIQLFKSPHRDNMHQLHRKLSEVEASRIQLLAKKKNMLEKAKVNTVLRVNFQSDFYQGASVRAGEHVFAPDKSIKGPGTIEFIATENRFDAGTLKPLECTYQQAEQTKGDKK
jgi:uncharacterized protein (DUF342 family)